MTVPDLERMTGICLSLPPVATQLWPEWWQPPPHCATDTWPGVI